MRSSRLLRDQALARAQARRMTELSRVIQHELRAADPGGEFHDVSTGYEIRGEYEHTPRPVGFTVPELRDTPGMH